MRKGISVIALLAWFALGGASTKCQDITNLKRAVPSSTASTRIGPALPRTVYAPLVRSHELPFAEIALNNRSPQPTEVTLVFHSKNGDPSGPVTITLKPGEVRHIDVDDLMPEVMKYQSELGGLFVQYAGQWNQVAAQLTLISENRKGSMDEPLRPDTDFLSGVQDAVWYLPEDGAASIALGNTTAADIVAMLIFPGEESREVKLHPYETQVITLHPNSSSEAEKKDRVASVRVETSAPAGALRAVGYVTLGNGMARTIRFYERATVRQPDLFAANLSTQNSEIQMVLKNISDKPITATPRFVPVGAGSASPLELPVITLLPGEAKVVDCTPLQELATTNETFSRVGVHERNSGEKGSLIGSLASLDLRAGNGYEIPLRDSGTVRNSGGSYPIRLDNDYSTFVTLMNVSNDPVEFIGIIRYSGGDYTFKPKKLGPGESVLFDIKDLRDRKVPDPSKKTLPEDFERGQFNWSMHLGGEVPRMIGRSQIVSASRGVSASYSCPICCPDSGPHFEFNPFTLLMLPGGLQLLATYDYSLSCYGGVTSWPSVRPLTSANPSIADSYYVDPEQGQAQGNGYAPGSTVQFSDPYTVNDWQNDGMDCYYAPYTEQGGQPLAVATLAGPTSVTRGSSATFTIQNAGSSPVISNWRFSDGTNSVNRTTNPAATTWTGVMVTGGTVTVTVVQGQQTLNLSKSITVNARNWHTTPASVTQVANGTFITLPVPPQASSLDSGLGAFQWRATDSGAPGTTIADNGPNQGFYYYTSPLTFSVFDARYEINPDLENSASAFSQHQCGNYSASSNPNGFISWADLHDQTRRHEYASSIQSHYAFYSNAVNANNPGDYVESRVGPPGTSIAQFDQDTRDGRDARYVLIGSATAVEPYGVNVSESGAFLGNINYLPYATCN